MEPLGDLPVGDKFYPKGEEPEVTTRTADEFDEKHPFTESEGLGRRPVNRQEVKELIGKDELARIEQVNDINDSWLEVFLLSTGAKLVARKKGEQNQFAIQSSRSGDHDDVVPLLRQLRVKE